MVSQLRVNGVGLNYELTGAEGPALVFVHGSWVDHHSWDALVPLLNGFRILTYDRRGHGQSERTARSADAEKDAHDLIALVEALDLRRSHLVGNSFGAVVALRAATLRPDLWMSLVMHEPPAFGVLAESAEDHLMRAEVETSLARVRELLAAERWEEGARAFFEADAFGSGDWDGMTEAARAVWIANAPAFLDQMADFAWAMPDRTALARLPLQVLISKGNRSPVWQQRVVSLLAPGGCATIGGAGHAPQVTHPEQYVNLLSLFIDSVSQIDTTPE